MMKKQIITLLLLMFPVGLMAQNTWVEDPYHSTLGFTVKHLGIADVPGHFNDYSVTITAAEEDFSDAQVELTAQTASVYTRVQDRDDHLRSEDFFYVEAYPEMTFSSTSVRTVEEGVFELTGDLTILDVTREVTVTMHHRGTVENPMADGAPTAGIQIVGEIDRSDFGLGDGFPPPMISNTVVIKADGEFMIQ
jgi:polyisoprenoid-binding protein YceI